MLMQVAWLDAAQLQQQSTQLEQEQALPPPHHVPLPPGVPQPPAGQQPAVILLQQQVRPEDRPLNGPCPAGPLTTRHQKHVLGGALLAAYYAIPMIAILCFFIKGLKG